VTCALVATSTANRPALCSELEAEGYTALVEPDGATALQRLELPRPTHHGWTRYRAFFQWVSACGRRRGGQVLAGTFIPAGRPIAVIEAAART
jgi:hypothetical protein